MRELLKGYPFFVSILKTYFTLLNNFEQNFISVFTIVQARVRMKLLKDMGSEENEHCKVN